MNKLNNESLSFLGQTFQLKLLSQILTDKKFAEKIINVIQATYFDNPNYRQIIVFIKDYFEKYENIPNFDNMIQMISIEIKDEIQKEYLNEIVKLIKKQSLEDGIFIQDKSLKFCKQQELKKALQYCNKVLEKGEFENYDKLEDKLRKTLEIGEENDDGIDVMSGIEDVLLEDYRKPIPTGIKGIDKIIGGGLSKGELGVILAPTGIGKEQPLSAKILTPNGWTTMGEIKKGDKIIGSDGNNQEVLDVFPQGEKDIYTVKFNDGTKTQCGLEHLWSVNSRNMRFAKTRKDGKSILKPKLGYKTITTKEIKNNLIGSLQGHLNYKIPTIKPVKFIKNELIVSPYVLGIMLGDGYFKRSSFSTKDNQIIEEVKNIYDDTVRATERVRKVNVFENGDMIVKEHTIFDVGLHKGYKKFRELGVYECVSNNKFIPKKYKYSSIEDRIEILSGLLDSDGEVGKSGVITFSSVSKQLIEDVREIVLSLGGYCSLSKSRLPFYYDNFNNKKKGQRSYRINISFSKEIGIVPFKLKRKKDRVILRNKYAKNKFIKSIEYSHREEAKCILVSNSDNLYVTDDYILTHNTSMLTKIANTGKNLGYNVLQIIFEDTDVEIRRKHISCWTGIPLNKLSENKEIIIKKMSELKNETKFSEGRLHIKRFSSDDTTINKIKNFIKRQISTGFKPDIIVLDYLDCVVPNRRTDDINVGEGAVIRSFESMLYDLNMVGWLAVQGNRCIDINEKVTTDKGIIKIGKIKEGDKILTHKGFKTVLKTYPIQKQYVYEIKLKSGKKINVSSKHEFPTLCGNLKSISNGLMVGDKLFIKKR